MRSPRIARLLVAIALVACTPRRAGEDKDAGARTAEECLPVDHRNGQTLRAIDEAELGAICLMATVPSPPDSSTSYKTGILATEELSDRYPWVIIDATLPERTPKEQVEWYALRFEASLMNAPVGSGLCRRDWAQTKRRGIVSVLLRTSGDEQSGEYLLIGGTGDKPSRRWVTKTSRVEARKKVLEMGFGAFGRRLRSVDAASEWAELAP